ncbi:MAG: DUF3566 domain-containing protein [Acidimicrobiales bacterium]
MAQSQEARRVVRRIDPWTVLRFSAMFYGSLLLVVLVAGALLWIVAASTGVIDNVERFVTELFVFESFQLRGPVALRTGLVGGLVLVLLGTGANVLMAVFYNLTSDVVGGIEVTVVEEEAAPRP